jgi:DNA-binding transcriptional LysR family regulator
MQIECLQVFCDVARCRSFSQAALANGVTQSAVSQVVMQLERRLGVQLVDRSVRPLQLTAAGQVYYDGCKALVEQYHDLEAAVRDVPNQLAGTVQVAAIYSVGLGDMGQHVERFHAAHPGARVHVEYLHPDRVYERVLAGTADLGLVSFPRPGRKLTAVPWREEEMVLACAPQHPFAARPSIEPGQLDGVRYVGFDRDLTIRRELDRFLREHGIGVDVALEFDNIENIKKAVEVAAGVSLLPEPTVRREVASGALVAVPLAGCRFVRPLGILYHRQRPLSATAWQFLELLRQPAGNGSPSRPPSPAHRPGRRARTRKTSPPDRNGAGRSSRTMG